MSARARRPTDDLATEVFDDARARHGPPTGQPEAFELAATEVTPTPGPADAEWETPTQIDPAPVAPGEPAAPKRLARGAERSEPIRVISMKDAAEARASLDAEARVPLHVQLRSIAEVAGLHDQPADLGTLAPPRDPRKARARRRRDNLVWLGVAFALAGLIMLAIWLVAGR
jgi:hypothetical protein